MKILVTGGAGFIGSHLVEKLVERGDKVTVLDDLSAGKLNNLEKVINHIQFWKGSVEDNSVFNITANTEVIFHLATHCLVKGLEDPRRMHEVNDIGTFNVCMAAKENKNKIVFISTSEVYGTQYTFPLKETATLFPMSIYGQTKAIAEQYVKFFHRIYGIPAVIIRPFNTFGPRQREDGYAGVITSFIKRIEAGKPPIIYGDGYQTRDFSYVSDIVDGIILVSVLNDGETVNLGSGKETSILKLAETMLPRKSLPPYPKFDSQQSRINDLRRLQADITLAKSFGYEPKVTVEEGLKKYVEWWKQKSIRNR